MTNWSQHYEVGLHQRRDIHVRRGGRHHRLHRHVQDFEFGALNMSINKKNFRRVLKIVEASAPKGRSKLRFFDYSDWFTVIKPHATVEEVVKHPCGTTGCLGGWASILDAYDENKSHSPHFIPDGWTRAIRFLGIKPDSGDGSYLFYGDWHCRSTLAPHADVVMKLKNIIRTGKVRNPRFDSRYQTEEQRARALSS